MDSRCYWGAKGRTKFKQLRFSWRDLVGTLVTLIFFGLIVWDMVAPFFPILVIPS